MSHGAMTERLDRATSARGPASNHQLPRSKTKVASGLMCLAKRVSDVQTREAATGRKPYGLGAWWSR